MFPHPLKKVVLLALVGALGLVPELAQADGDSMTSAKAYQAKAADLDYKRFFEQESQFYLVNPRLVEVIFLGLVDLKGNPEVAKHKIRTEVLGCPEGDPLRTHCILDRLYQEKRTKKVPNLFEIPVNFTRVEKGRRDQGQVRLKLAWRQEPFEAPVIEVDDFFAFVGAAAESDFYKRKEEVKQIVFNAHFENHFEILLPLRLAGDLQKLYEPIPEDLKDRIFYRAEGADLTIEENLASANLRFKAEQVKINNRLVEAAPEPLRH